MRRSNDERNFRIKYAEVLNPAQYEAVTHREGPLLVVAGAGSGKTRTLIYRVARLIESGVPPGAILLLTFTRRASQEMLRRAEQLVGDRDARGRGRHLSFVREHCPAPMGRAARAQAQLHHSRSRRHGRRHQSAAQPDGTRFEGATLSEKGHARRSNQHGAQQKARTRRRDRTRFPASDRARRGNSSSSREKYDVYKRERGLLDYDDLLDKLGDPAAATCECAPAPVRHLSLHHDR